MAGWGVLAPFWGPELDVERRVEVVDHVVPGGVVLVAAVAALALRLRGTSQAVAGGAAALAGFWMTSTHVPLVASALDGRVTWAATAHHGLPGLAVAVAGGLWLRRIHAGGDREPPGSVS